MACQVRWWWHELLAAQGQPRLPAPSVHRQRAGQRIRELDRLSPRLDGHYDRVAGTGADMSGPKLICINLRPHTTTQAPERGRLPERRRLRDAVFGVVAAFLGEDAGRFVAEVESAEF
jgi:hypothetical protein